MNLMRDYGTHDMDEYVKELACRFANTDDKLTAVCRLSTSLLIQIHNLESYMLCRGLNRKDFESYCDDLQHDLNNRLH